MSSTKVFRSSVSLRSSRPCSGARRHVAVRAQEEPEKLTFTPTKNAAYGFTDDDSAGQSNIFAVEPKTYVSSKVDENSSATLLIGGVGAAIALIVLVVGLSANSNNVSAADTVYAEAGKYQSLAYYAKALK